LGVFSFQQVCQNRPRGVEADTKQTIVETTKGKK